MLLGYGAKNCWCFKDWLVINLRLDGYAPKEISQNKNYSLVMGFEGANASGKTNALQVLWFITDFAKNSFGYTPESTIPFESFFFDTKNASEFYIEFSTEDSQEYRYEAIMQFSMEKSTVKKETLFRIVNNSEEILFERDDNNIITNNICSNEIKIILRSNCSFISTLHQYEIHEIDNFYNFFSKIKSANVTHFGLNNNLKDIDKISETYSKEKEAFSFAKKMIKEFDTGVENIDIKEFEEEHDGIKRKRYIPFFKHINNQNQFGLGLESAGTIALYCNLLFYYNALKNGEILIFDEFDIHLHHDILPYLLELFTVTTTNPKGSQFLFTSLNPGIMDILGRYRTYLFEKENSESFCYRLDEPETNILRNDRLISTPYKKHLIGGCPKIERS